MLTSSFQGASIWDGYREFEMAILDSFEVIIYSLNLQHISLNNLHGPIFQSSPGKEVPIFIL